MLYWEVLSTCPNGVSAKPDCLYHRGKEIQIGPFLCEVFYQIFEVQKVRTRIIIPCAILGPDLR